MKVRSNKSIGNFVRYFRNLHDYSQKELSKILNVTESCISAWERGISKPNIEIALFLSEHLKVDIKDIYFEPEVNMNINSHKIYERICLSRLFIYLKTIAYSNDGELAVAMTISGLTIDKNYIQDELSFGLRLEDYSINPKIIEIEKIHKSHPFITPETPPSLIKLESYEVLLKADVKFDDYVHLTISESSKGIHVPISKAMIYLIEKFSLNQLLLDAQTHYQFPKEDIMQALLFQMNTVTNI